MTISDYIHILNHPDDITSTQTQELEDVLKVFPYFQSARAVYLKGLFSQNSYKYNADLKITAAYTTDRSILFEFITSKTFKSITKSDNSNKFQIKDIEINQFEVVTKVKAQNLLLDPNRSIIQENEFENKLADIFKNKRMLNNFNNEDADLTATATEAIIDDTILAISEQTKVKPIEFNTNESHSFSQWLKLTNMQPIDRSNELEEKNSNLKEMESDIEKENKFKLIDKFIEKNPKIVPVKNAPITPINIDRSTEEKSYLMTETLARVYLEQKKYQKAMQAYEILILKYPEKSSLFAERIVEIKNIQNNN